MAVSRRDFLRTTSVAGLGLYFARSGYAAPKSPNEKLNIGCIGVGGQGGSDLNEVAKLGDNIVALCDINRDVLAKRGADFPGARLYTDYRMMFHGETDLDAVIVGIPDHNHAPAAAMALARGIHCYCEKPLTHTPYEARFLAELARKKKLATQMGNQGHASDGLREAVEIMRAGTLGEVREIHVWTDRPTGWWPQGVTKPTEAVEQPSNVAWEAFLGPAPWRPYHPAYQPFVWRGWWDFGTGAVGDIACHMADAVFWGLNLGDPIRISAESDGSGTVDSPPNKARQTYTFPNGTTLTWHDGKQKPATELFLGQPIPGNGSLMVGSKGTLLLDGTSSWKLLPEASFTGFVKPTPSLPRSPGNHAEWLRAARGGEPCLGGFEYSGHLTEVMLLGNIALRSGETIEWDAKRMRVTNHRAAQQYVSKHYRPGWDVHELSGTKPLFPQ